MKKTTVEIKETLFNILIKLFFLFLLLFFFAFDYAAICNIKKDILTIYCSMMAASLFFFGLTFFPKIRIKAYVAFALCITGYLYMYNNTEEIVEERQQINCLEIGLIYDPVQKICRDDCWTWDKEKGCLKETE